MMPTKASMHSLKKENPFGKTIKYSHMNKIKLVGVVGAGTMGAALAQKFAMEGFNVILCDRERGFLEKGMNGIRKMLNEGLEKKNFSKAQVDATLFNIMDSLSLS